jgi:hypothetical protein
MQLLSFISSLLLILETVLSAIDRKWFWKVSATTCWFSVKTPFVYTDWNDLFPDFLPVNRFYIRELSSKVKK